MVAHQTDLEVGDFVWTGGDCHLYLNHLEQVDTQLAAHAVPAAAPGDQAAPANAFRLQLRRLRDRRLSIARRAEGAGGGLAGRRFAAPPCGPGTALRRAGIELPRRSAAAAATAAPRAPRHRSHRVHAGHFDHRHVRNAVQWHRNRQVTLGHRAGRPNGPGDPVSRASMARFMNRLGAFDEQGRPPKKKPARRSERARGSGDGTGARWSPASPRSARGRLQPARHAFR